MSKTATAITIGIEATINLLDKKYQVYLLPISPLDEVQLVPDEFEELQAKLEKLDIEKNKKEYIEVARELTKQSNKIIEKKLKLMVVGKDSDDLIDRAKDLNILPKLLEDLQAVINDKKK